MAGVLVIGSLIVDMVITAPHLPEPGENVHGTGFAMVPGGKGANQAVAASRLGEDARLMGCVGADAFGDFLVESLAPDGVDSILVKRSPDVPTGVALIAIEEGTGMNTIVVDPGANMALTVEDLDAVEPFYTRAGIALFQLEIPLDVVAEGARRAHDHGLVTVLDAGPPRDADLDLLAAFDVVSPNARELADLAGREVRDIKSAVRAAKELEAAGIKRLVVKMGEEGALLITSGQAVHLPPFEIDAVDSTGAGDAFTAGLAVALAEGASDEEAVRFANAAGASAVTVMGALPSMPARSAVASLLARGESA